MPYRYAFVAIALFAYLACKAQAEEPLHQETFKSPDGKSQLEAKFWLKEGAPAARIDIELKQGSDIVFKTTIPEEKECRYVKASWSPTSQTALVMLNFKSSEDWIVLQTRADIVEASFFNGEKLVGTKLLDALPFNDSIKNIAPNGRVAANSIKWDGDESCSMSFLYRGIGYEGTANLLINLRTKRPTLTVTSIVPQTDAALWKAD